ncbi:TetR/AcrR family transcriptional regulator [Sporomusa acidovorans]|uniref:HTH tetR-type domain-containing protein n=1 Tax=Sporomusa acidovorans (strain ATCC 49682 / DSM 3132 / Mol) TaxID=1123286 RepID=A0ABZ3J9C9_SPOA4|nr:TetR/AcrR family transcriptional regulator [Sporomusa acidovorans]OZC16743.1 biofilm operon icaADBC HTH-type negative transcriptional regulator IcaR [Sporomusa acidovorans DSM 3132]SDE04023.1 transcriptional regulator, TetR family [Sporomusa acidovorans]
MTKKAPKEQRMEEIIEAAVNEFVVKGYEGTSMQSIAERAGLTKGGLYYHFGSKDEILLAANGRYFEPILEMIQTAEAKNCPVEGLRYFIYAYLQHWSRHSREMIFTLLSLSKILVCAAMWPLINNYSEEMISFYERLLVGGIRAGKFRSHNAHSQATALFAALDGVTPYLITSQTLTPESLARQFEATFIDVLLDIPQ